MTNQLNITFLKRCLDALQRAFDLLQQYDASTVEYDLYRAAVIKEFELILEQVGKLLKKILKPYFSSSNLVDKLTFKDVFRSASKHGFILSDEVERWFIYRDNRNSTAHDYGFEFANKTLEIIPQFIIDVKTLIQLIEKQDVDS